MNNSIYLVISVYNSPTETNDFNIEGVFKNKKDACGCIKDFHDWIIDAKGYEWITNIRSTKENDMPECIVFSDSNELGEHEIEIYIEEKELI